MRVPEHGSISISLRVGSDAADLRLGGRFDISTSPAFHDVFEALHGRDVAIDLRDLTFMDGAAWLDVMDLDGRVRDWGRRFTVLNVPSRIREMFVATQTEHLLAESASSR